MLPEQSLNFLNDNLEERMKSGVLQKLNGFADADCYTLPMVEELCKAAAQEYTSLGLTFSDILALKCAFNKGDHKIY